MKTYWSPNKIASKQERAQAMKWSKAATHDADDILEALEEALRLLKNPEIAYRQAGSLTRRMLNQALFERILITEDGITGAVPAPWVAALHAVATKPGELDIRPDVAPEGPDRGQKAVRRLLGGHGSNVDQMVRLRGLEPPRP